MIRIPTRGVTTRLVLSLSVSSLTACLEKAADPRPPAPVDERDGGDFDPGPRPQPPTQGGSGSGSGSGVVPDSGAPDQRDAAEQDAADLDAAPDAGIGAGDGALDV